MAKPIVCKRCNGPSHTCDDCGRGTCRHLTIKRDGKDRCGPCHLKHARGAKIGSPGVTVIDGSGNKWIVRGAFLEDEDGERFTRDYVETKFGAIQ